MADQRVLLSDEKNERISNAIMLHPSFSSSLTPKWQEIANGLRAEGIVTDGRKIRELWVNYLNPSLNFNPFTEEEMQTLKRLYFDAKAQGQTRMLKSGKLQMPLQQNGETMSWELILPGRSPNVLKNKYYSLQKYWNQPERQPDQDQLYNSVDSSSSAVRDDDIQNNYEFYGSDLHARGQRGDSPPPFAFPLTTMYDGSPGAAAASYYGSPPYSHSVERTDGGKVVRKYRKTSRKYRNSARKYRKASRKSSRKSRKMSRK